MSLILKKTVLLAFCISILYAAICPTGDLKISSFTKLAASNAAQGSDFYNSMY